MDQSDRREETEDPVRIQGLTDVLVRLARGEFDARAPRNYRGDPWDVLSFMVNAMAEEVALLVSQLEQERKELEATRAQLVQAEKLSALGELAGGVAHELNQPLTAVGALSELIREHPDDPVRLHDSDLALIEDAVRRMGRIVSAVRTFARQAPLLLAPTSPIKPVNDALVLVREAFEQLNITISVDVESDLPLIDADRDRLSQVFVNLFTNARDAVRRLPEGHSRIIRVVVEREAEWICYTVSDTGLGIDESVGHRIFDPFFTTKEVGDGTGLGLSISHGIIMDHGGTIELVGSCPRGTQFSLRLPIHAKEKEGAQP